MLVESYIAHQADVNAVSRNSLRNTPLNSAVAANRTAIVRYLLKKGADAGFRQEQGITPLHAAAANGNNDIVRLLLDHQADPRVKDDKGETPLDKAMHRGHTATASLLSLAQR
jgi:ankyrin repeat protein